ncbi:hypothetical protein WMY93_029192 [Mugilogobius chulae]|uniref:SWIM-type domain-containing protein n=1 Tax=Mugilogobius chulae TaxID=88201 RepID=A0AAW0MX82_9GOBI
MKVGTATKLSATTYDISTKSLDMWLIEFQTINSMTLRLGNRKKETKGYVLQNYYRCQHNTRNWSPSKDPQKKLTTNPSARCGRSEIFTRGNQTNNFVEAQFLVLKDTILNRIKEYNVVALLEKITMDMEQHYKEKLLSVSDGSYDCNLRSRFSGKASSKNDRLGFRVPTEEEQRRLTSSIKEFPNDVFEVDSLSETGQRYTVDMVLGCCSCDQGKDGSPCKHQYVLWASNISNNVNFIPVSSPLLRQKLAYIALGKSLPLQHYTTLRNKVSSAEPQPNNTEYLLPVREEPQPMETTVAERFEDEASVTHSGSGTQLVQEAIAAMDDAYNVIDMLEGLAAYITCHLLTPLQVMTAILFSGKGPATIGTSGS